MSEGKLENNNEEIEELTKDETAEVNVVPRKVVIIIFQPPDIIIYSFTCYGCSLGRN